jgi:hypothetical protein
VRATAVRSARTKPDTAPAETPSNRHPRSTTVDRPTDGPELSRWRDAAACLPALQAEYAAWHDTLPDSLRDSATAETLQEILDLDLDALIAIVPPRRYGRD